MSIEMNTELLRILAVIDGPPPPSEEASIMFATKMVEFFKKYGKDILTLETDLARERVKLPADFGAEPTREMLVASAAVVMRNAGVTLAGIGDVAHEIILEIQRDAYKAARAEYFKGFSRAGQGGPVTNVKRDWGDGWLPIDSMPKDGTRVELLSANGKTDKGAWVTYTPGFFSDCAGEISSDNGEGNTVAWRPIP